MYVVRLCSASCPKGYHTKHIKYARSTQYYGYWVFQVAFVLATHIPYKSIVRAANPQVPLGDSFVLDLRGIEYVREYKYRGCTLPYPLQFSDCTQPHL
jgi:hypothetical protein